MHLLDTNVLSELRRPDRAHAGLRAWAEAASIADFFISAITLLELETGVLRVERRDARQGQVLRSWLDGQVIPRFADRVLPVDAAVALCCARLHVPDPRSERDALIAATAIVHKMTVVTRNVADFAPMGVAILDPWKEAPA